MNIEQQLRAALSLEADMQNAPAPDVDSLIVGGRARQRRRHMARVGVVAACAAIVAGGVYGVTKIDIGAAGEPAQKPHTTTPTGSPRTTSQPYLQSEAAISPGRYQMLVGVDDGGVAFYADLTFDNAGWRSENYPVLSDTAGHHGAVAVYQPLALAAGNGCLSDKANTHVGTDPQSVAHQLANLPRSTVVQQPTPVQAFGRDAIHLRTRINNDCGNDVYRVAETLLGGHGISYSDTPSPVVMDFWVLEVGGVPVVVDKWHDAGASSQLVHEITRLRNSISFVTGG